MRSVTVRLNAAEFSAAMSAVAEWLEANRCEPTRYRYDHDMDAIHVTVDFSTEMAAQAFAARFDGVLRGAVGAGQFIGEMGVMENRPRSATVRAASEVELEFLTPAEFVDEIAGSPQTAREVTRRLSRRLREADDRIVNDERRSGRALGNWKNADDQTAVLSLNNAYLAAMSPWLQRRFHTPVELGDLPFVVGRRPGAGEGPPLWQPDLMLDDTAPFRLSRSHFAIEKRNGGYHVRDLCSTLGTIVNGEPIGDHFHRNDAPLRVGENEVIAGGVDSPFAFSVFIP